MWHDFIILTTFLLYLFDQGDVHNSFILFKNENWKLRSTGALENVHDTKHG